MVKIDYKKELKNLYKPSAREVKIVEVPPMNFLMVDGQGDPNISTDYQAAVEALFSLSYALKFMIKKSGIGVDYGVLPLESLWWVEDMSKFNINKKDEWLWTAMMMQPEFVNKELFEAGRLETIKKKGLPALDTVRFEAFFEGKAAQIMHIGPFSEEGPTVEKLHDFIKANGYHPTGKHHEIYLSDIRKAAPEKWKTIIRQPLA